MPKYIITATSEFLDDSPDTEVVIDMHLTRLKEGKSRLIDYFEDAKITIQEIPPVAPDTTKWLECKRHGEQPFVLSFAPDVYSCPISNCATELTWQEVHGDQYRQHD